MSDSAGNVVRELNVKQHARARAHELHSLQRALTSTGGSKRVFQMLPKHLRRRASSHNIYRIPVRLRTQAKRELDRAPPVHQKRSRRVRRRKPELRQEALRRQEKGDRWLPTHLWAVKRMNLTSKWGYKIPYRPSDKGTRSGYRSSSHGCVAQDLSYLSIIQLQGSRTVIQSVLGARELEFTPYASGARHGGFMLTDKTRGSDIGPVSFVFRPVVPLSELTTLWLIIHPAMYSEALTYLESVFSPTSTSAPGQGQGVTVTHIDTVGIIDLHGPQSHRALQHALKVAPGNDTQSSVLDRVTSMRSPSTVPARCVVGAQCIVPSQGWRYREGKVEDSVTTIVEWPPDNASSLLWEQHGTDRDKPFVFASSKGRDEELVAWKSRQPSEDSPSVPLLLLHLASPMRRGYGSGWRVLLPRNAVSVFWQAFIETGARPIGLDNKDLLCLESGILRFPRDFPTTRAYESYVREEREKRQERHRKLPKGKQSMVTLIPEETATRWQHNDQSQATTTLPCIPVSLTARSKGVLQDWQDITLDNKCIGTITSAHHSYCRGKGFAIGRVNTEPSEGWGNVVATVGGVEVYVKPLDPSAFLL